MTAAMVAASSNIGRWRLTAAAASMGAAIDPTARRRRRRSTSLGKRRQPRGTGLSNFLTDDSSVGGSDGIIISNSNGGRWQRTTAAASMEAAVDPAARRQRRRDTSLDSVLTDGSSVDGSGMIIISSKNGGRWRRTKVAVSTEVAVEPAARHQWCSGTSSGGFLTDDSSVWRQGQDYLFPFRQNSL